MPQLLCSEAVVANSASLRFYLSTFYLLNPVNVILYRVHSFPEEILLHMDNLDVCCWFLGGCRYVERKPLSGVLPNRFLVNCSLGVIPPEADKIPG